ncbi:MAG: hypothetical protein AAB785_00745 [Patescibacteria group bacterium]
MNQMNQRTSKEVKPISEGLARHMGRMVEDASRKYHGGAQKLELVKGHPEFQKRLFGLFDELAAEREAMLSLIGRSPFAKIQIGTFGNAQDLRRALIDGNNRIERGADDLLGRITLVSEPATLDLYRATNAELGLSRGGTAAQLFDAIEKIGGEKLPAEAGPQYRLQNPDQPVGGWELVFSDPLTYCDGFHGMFSVRLDGGDRWLQGFRDNGATLLVCVCVFGRKRPSVCT